MTRQDFENKKEELQKQLGMGFEIVVGYFSEADYMLGCYYNDEKGMWIVYQNHERGINYIFLETPSEEEAFERLYSRIQFHIENRTS